MHVKLLGRVLQATADVARPPGVLRSLMLKADYCSRKLLDIFINSAWQQLPGQARPRATCRKCWPTASPGGVVEQNLCDLIFPRQRLPEDFHPPCSPQQCQGLLLLATWASHLMR